MHSLKRKKHPDSIYRNLILVLWAFWIISPQSHSGFHLCKTYLQITLLVTTPTCSDGPVEDNATVLNASLSTIPQESSLGSAYISLTITAPSYT